MTVREIDATIHRYAVLLHWLQLEILPADTPCSTQEGWWWLATDDGHPLGFAGLVQSSQWSDTGYLCRAGVLEKARGNGLQKRLIQARERKARALGWKWLVTDTYENPASANSLISCGFRMFKPSNPWGADGVCYWKKAI